jgi:hypothetical protein
METTKIPRADEIRWQLDPLSYEAWRNEDYSAEFLLSLSPAELLHYCADLRDDLRALRQTLHQALTLVARQQDQISKAARVVDFQRRQIRDLADRRAA